MIEEVFQRIYTSLPEVVVRAPGRVNLIGEHTDYNEGFVLPAAIDRAITYAGRRRADRRVRVYSNDFQASAEFDLDNIQKASENTWSNFLRGVSKFLEADGHHLTGADIAFGGDVPREAGLSSSAAVEVGAVVFWKKLLGLTLDPIYIIKLARRTKIATMPNGDWPNAPRRSLPADTGWSFSTKRTSPPRCVFSACKSCSI